MGDCSTLTALLLVILAFCYFPNNGDCAKLSLELANQLDELGDINLFFDKYLVNKEKYYKDNPVAPNEKSTTIGKPRSKRFYNPRHVPPSAESCFPVKAKVSLVPKNAPSDFVYVPECAHVHRCSGCCNNDLLACKPLLVANSTFVVYETNLTAKMNKLRYERSFETTFEDHVVCGCICKIQASDCQSTQVYDSDSCLCSCNKDVPDGRDDCESQSKIWNKETCSCTYFADFIFNKDKDE